MIPRDASILRFFAEKRPEVQGPPNAQQHRCEVDGASDGAKLGRPRRLGGLDGGLGRPRCGAWAEPWELGVWETGA